MLDREDRMPRISNETEEVTAVPGEDARKHFDELKEIKKELAAIRDALARAPASGCGRSPDGGVRRTTGVTYR